MKNIIIRGFSTIGFLLIIFGCTKMLNLTPQTEISDAVYWNTPADFKAATGQFYNDITHGWMGGDKNADILVGSGPGTINSGIQVGDIQVPTSDGWGSAYSKIRTINNVLDKAMNFSKPADLKQYIAEAHFFRAWQYYLLYQTYGGVPLITKVLDVNSPELLAPRETNENTINFILAELELAIPDLPLQRNIAATENGRISNQAALALKARVCLFEATWRKYHSSGEYNTLLDKSIAASDQVIASGDFQIFNRPDKLGDFSYKYMFILENALCNPGNLTKVDNKEYVFYKKHDSTYGLPVTGGSGVWLAPFRKLIDMFVCKNGLPITYNGQTNPQFLGYKAYRSSEMKNRDLRMTSLVRRDSIVYYTAWGQKSLWGNPLPPTAANITAIGVETMTGYWGDKIASERYILDASQYTIDYPLIRYADVLLMYAEAKIEKDGQISDADLNKTINLLRNRAGVANLTNGLLAGTGLNMRDEIRRERTCELYYENDFRLYDLKRWHIVQAAMTEDILGIYLGADGPWAKQLNSAGKLATNGDGFYLLTSKSKRQWKDEFDYSPIAYDQLKLNPNLKQNPGYPDGR